MTASKLILKWTDGNEKMVITSDNIRKVIGFGLPAKVTCIDAGACLGVCFGLQGRYKMPAVIACRQHNYDLSQHPDFGLYLVHDITILSKKFNTFRIHDVGDFYSQEYLDAWYEAMRLFPEIAFYAYTKSLSLDLYTNKPDNFQIIQSLGGRRDDLVDLNKPHSRIFTNRAALNRAGYVYGSDSDIHAINGEIRIGLCYHGTKNMTEPQKVFFE